MCLAEVTNDSNKKKTVDVKTIWIPDVHNKTEIADAIITREVGPAITEPIRVIFAGDYFDMFYDTPADSEKVAKWLVAKVKERTNVKYTFLIGNHDVPYLYPHLAKGPMECPGWSPEKAAPVTNSGLVELADQFQLHTWHEGWLLTHAGLSYTIAKTPEGELLSDADINFMLNEEYELLNSREVDARTLVYMQYGERMGREYMGYGGVTWCDWEQEFIPIPGLNQLVGHTPDRQPRHKTNAIRVLRDYVSLNWCGDTNLKYYAVWTKKGWEWREAPKWKEVKKSF